MVSSTQNGTEAQDYCQSNYLNGNLASISDSTENQAVFDTCNGGTCWIGLQNYPALAWYDGTAYSYTNWSPNEPDGGASQPCVMINVAGLWITGGCDNQLQSVCEYGLYPS